MPPLCATVAEVKIVFMGSGDFACTSLEILARTHAIISVITSPDRPAGRSQKLKVSPIKSLAQRLGLFCLQPEKVGDEECISQLRAFMPEIIIVVAYGQILPQTILSIPHYGCINVHASLLPKYRGAAPVAHAILHGDPYTGVTIMQMDQGLDTGPLFLQRRENILPDDTTATLEPRLAMLGAQLLVETLDQIATHKITPRPQDPSQASLAPKLRKEDGHIDWTLSAEQIEQRVRAFNPWPTAFSFVGQMRLQIWSAHVLKDYGEASVITRKLAATPPQTVLEPPPTGLTALGEDPFVRDKVNDLMKQEAEMIQPIVEARNHGCSEQEFEAALRKVDQWEDAQVAQVVKVAFLHKQELVMRDLDRTPWNQERDWQTWDYTPFRRDVFDQGRWIGRVVQDRNGHIVWYDRPDGPPHWIRNLGGP